MSQLLADHSLERDALDFFPTPLADALDEASAESSTRAQRDKVVETFRVAIRLLGLMALAAAPGPAAVTSQLASLNKKLLRQGLTDGEWVGVVREIMRPFAAKPDGFAVPPLVSTLFYNNGKPSAVFDHQGVCDKLLAMRKADTVAHGVSGTEQTALDVLSVRLPDFEIFLKALAWLWQVAFVVPVSRKAQSDGTPEYSVLKLIGVTPRRGFRPEPLAVPAEMKLGHVYALIEGKPALGLYPFVQYVETATGQSEVFLFDEVSKQDVVLRTYPTGQKHFDPESLVWLRTKFSPESAAAADSYVAPQVNWTLDSVRIAARKASDDYLDKMQRERVYVPHLYARRFALEEHLSGFLDPKCAKSGMLIVGTSGIGKTNTLCHIVRQWREDVNKLVNDVTLFVGGSTLPGGQFALRDVLLDRLELSDSFPTFLSAFEAQRKKNNTQLVILVDGVDKHPQPAELLRQLDALIVQAEALSWFKIVVSIGEVTYTTIRKAGFIPAVRDYYAVAVKQGASERESTEVVLGRLTDEELSDAYEKYREEPGLAPTSTFHSLTEEVKNAIRNPLFLRVVMEVFNARKVPRRVLTAEVLLEYCNKKVFSEPNRMFFVNRFIDLLYDKRWTAANFDALAQAAELRQMVLDLSPQSPYLQLLDEQVLEEQLKRVSAILPPQRTIAFTYDRLLEYLLLNRIVERFGMGGEAIATLSEQALSYLPLRGVLTTLLLAKADEGSFREVVALLRTGNAEVMKLVARDLLVELEQMAPTTASSSQTELASSPIGQLVAAILIVPNGWAKSLLLDVSEKLQTLGFYRRAGFIYEKLAPWADETHEPLVAAALWLGSGEVKHIFGQKREALAEFEKSLRLYQAAADRDSEQLVLDAMGRVYHELGEMTTARDYFERSRAIDLELVTATGSVKARQGEAQTLIHLSDNCQAMGEISQAIEYAEAARQIYFDIGEQRGMGDALNRIGGLFRRQGFTEESRHYLAQALAMHQQIGYKKGTAESLYRLGIVYHTQGKWAEALAQYQDALRIYQEIGDKEGVADTFNVMGETYRAEGKLDEALQVYQQSLELERDIGGKRGVMMCLNNLGATYLFAGNAEKALDLLRQSTALQKEQGNVDGIPETLAFLSAATWQLGRADDALGYSQTAVQVLQHKNFDDDEVQLVHFYRYQIFAGIGRDEDADEALRIAYKNMMQQANAIKDSDVRHSFPQSSPVRREIILAWETRRLSASGG